MGLNQAHSTESTNFTLKQKIQQGKDEQTSNSMIPLRDGPFMTDFSEQEEV